MSETIEYFDELKSHPFLRGLSEELILRVTDCVVGIESWDADHVVFRSGGEASRCYLIQTGEVAIEMHSPGAGSRIVQTVARGKVLGWSWMFPPYMWSFDARVLTPTTAIVLDGEQIRECLGADPELGFPLATRFAELIAARLQATRLQLMDIYASRS